MPPHEPYVAVDRRLLLWMSAFAVALGLFLVNPGAALAGDGHGSHGWDSDHGSGGWQHDSDKSGSWGHSPDQGQPPSEGSGPGQPCEEEKPPQEKPPVEYPPEDRKSVV